MSYAGLDRKVEELHQQADFFVYCLACLSWPVRTESWLQWKLKVNNEHPWPEHVAWGYFDGWRLLEGESQLPLCHCIGKPMSNISSVNSRVHLNWKIKMLTVQDVQESSCNLQCQGIGPLRRFPEDCQNLRDELDWLSNSRIPPSPLGVWVSRCQDTVDFERHMRHISEHQAATLSPRHGSAGVWLFQRFIFAKWLRQISREISMI